MNSWLCFIIRHLSLCTEEGIATADTGLLSQIYLKTKYDGIFNRTFKRLPMCIRNHYHPPPPSPFRKRRHGIKSERSLLSVIETCSFCLLVELICDSFY